MLLNLNHASLFINIVNMKYMNENKALDEIEGHYGELSKPYRYEEYDSRKDIPFLESRETRVEGLGKVYAGSLDKYTKKVIRDTETREVEEIAYILHEDGKYFVFYTEKDSESEISVDLFGVNHISNESKEMVKKKLEDNSYDKCMIELDEERKKSFMDDSLGYIKLLKIPFQLFKTFSVKGILIGLVYLAVLPIILTILTIQNILGLISKVRGREKGQEFKQAISFCQNNEETELFLIDLHKSEYIKEIPVKKRLILLLGHLKATMESVIGGKKSIEKIIQESNGMVDEHPEIYKYLIEYRNNYMIGEIIENTDKSDERIAVIVGAMHVEEMKKELEAQNFRVGTEMLG